MPPPSPPRSPQPQTVSANPLRDLQLTTIVVDDTLTARTLMEKLLLRLGFARVDC